MALREPGLFAVCESRTYGVGSYGDRTMRLLRRDTAEIHHGSPTVARRLELEGDQYNGFRATVPVEELTVVDVRERDIDRDRAVDRPT